MIKRRKMIKRSVVSKGHTFHVDEQTARILWCHPGETTGSMACGQDPPHCETTIHLDSWIEDARLISTYYTVTFDPLTVLGCCFACGTCRRHVWVINDVCYEYYGARGVSNPAEQEAYNKAVMAYRNNKRRA